MNLESEHSLCAHRIVMPISKVQPSHSALSDGNDVNSVAMRKLKKIRKKGRNVQS